MCSVRPGHGVLQGHVLGSREGQPVRAVVVDQLGDAGEDTATLIQRVAQTLTALSLGHNDVHTTLTGPDRGEDDKKQVLDKNGGCVTMLIRSES